MVYGTGCKMYFDCNLQPQAHVCPEKQYFNGKSCSPEYTCPQPCEPVPEGLKLKNVIAMKEIKVNTSSGRYPVHGSGCKFYVEWSVDRYGNVHGIMDQCPELSWYDPRENRCKMRYYCPEYLVDKNKPTRCEGNFNFISIYYI